MGRIFGRPNKVVGWHKAREWDKGAAGKVCGRRLPLKGGAAFYYLVWESIFCPRG